MKKHFLFSLFVLLTCIVPAKAWNNMYLIGSATTGDNTGWTLDNAIEMTKINDAEFEWSGVLKAGELKFLTEKSYYKMYGPANSNAYSWWDGSTSYNNLVQRATYALQFFEKTDNANDYKFKIANEDYYTLRINLVEGKVTTFPAKIYPVGKGCNVGWNDKSSVALTETYFASEVYEGDLQLLINQEDNGDAGQLKFLNQNSFGRYQYGPANAGDKITGMGVYSIEGNYEFSVDKKYSVILPENVEYHIVADVRNGVKRNVLKVSKDITFQFKMNAKARQEWGDMPVVIRYWMYYQDADDDNAYDHTFYQTLTPDVDGVYTATIQAVAPVKFIIQTCSDNYGQWCGDGAHWTNEATNGGNGYTADRKFMLVYNDAHVLEEVSEFGDDTYTIRSHKGYASFAWMNAFSVPEGVEAYVGAWKNGDIELSRIADGVVPAYRGVILYDTQLRDTYEVTETTATAAAYNAMTNDLQGAATADVTRDENVTTYVLGDIDNVVAFYEYRGDYMPQYTAYLVAPVQTAAVQKQVRIRFAPEVTTDITPAETETGDGLIYDVTGRVYTVQDINELPQGIYFRNRTKTVVQK